MLPQLKDTASYASYPSPIASYASYAPVDAAADAQQSYARLASQPTAATDGYCVANSLASFASTGATHLTVAT